MEKVVAASGSADPAFVAVILLLGSIIVEKFALGTEELAHADTAILTDLLHILLMVAQGTDDLFHTVTVNLVTFLVVLLIYVFGVIVAMSAIKDLVAARSTDLASPSVMRTSMAFRSNRQLPILHQVCREVIVIVLNVGVQAAGMSRDDMMVCMRRDIVVRVPEVLSGAAAAEERRKERLHGRYKDRHADDLQPSHPLQQTGFCRFKSPSTTSCKYARCATNASP